MPVARMLALLLAASPLFAQSPPSLLDPSFAGTQISHGAAPQTGAGESETFGVRLAEGGTGVLRVGEFVRIADSLPTELADGSVYLEAESADQVDDMAGGAECPAFLKDAEASGGRYVDNPGFISVPFRTVTAGERDIWAHVREGKDEENRTLWTVDGGRIWCVSEEQEGKSGEWRWLKLGARNLAAGDHRLLNHHYYQQEFHFDRFAVLPEGSPAPEGAGPGPVIADVDLGVFETSDVTPPAVDALDRVSVKGELNGGSAEYEVSLDGGQSWTPVPDGDLSAVAVAGDGSDTVRFRVTLRRSPDGLSPEINGVDLTVKPNADAWLAARNDYVRVVFDAATGRLFRLTDLGRDRELLWPGAPTQLFEVDLKKPGSLGWLRYTDEKTFWVERDEAKRRDNTEEMARAEGLPADRADAVGGATATPATYQGGSAADGTIELRYTVQDSVELTFRVALDDTGQTLWSAQVSNGHPDLDVIRLKFPMVFALRLGESGMDDHQLRCQTFGHHRERPGIGAVRDEKYPGGVALPWQSHYDDDGGLGITARDPEALNVGFESKDNPTGYFEDVLNVGVRKYHCVPAGGGEATWEYALGVHPGQWHWVADRYREWALGHFQRPRYPEWFAENDGFYNTGLQNGGIPFTEMGRFGQGARRVGLKHIQVWGQFTGKDGGCCGPYWMPSPLYGTLDEFKAAIEQIHASGCKVGFFHLHDRLDLYHAEGSHIYGMVPKTAYPEGTEFPSHEFFVKHHWVGSPDGSTVYPLTDEQWAEYQQKLRAYQDDSSANEPPRKWHPVDISSPDWWEYMRHWAIDKYVGEWGADGHYFDVLGCGGARESFDLRKGHHGHSMSAPGKAGIPRTTTESARERGHDDYFLLMEGMCDVPGQWTAGMISGLYYNHSETMRYTWPDFVLFEGHSNSGHLTPIKSLESAFLNGNRFDIVHSNRAMSEITRARAGVRDWIYRARFMDTLGLDSPVPARLFLRREPGAQGVAITFVNRDAQTGTVTLDPAVAGDVRSGVAVDEKGRLLPVPVTREDGKLVLDVPDAYLCTAVLPAEVDAEHAIIAVGSLTHDGGGQIVVEAANLSDRPLTATLTAADLGPLGEAPAQALDLAAGEVGTARFDVDISPAFWQFVRASVDVRVGEASKPVELTAFPLVRDPSFEHTGNDEEQVVHGARSLRLDPNEGLYHKIYPLNFEPNRRYRLSLAYQCTPGEAQISGIRLWQRLGRSSEVNQAGFSFTPGEDWQRAEATLDSAPRFVSTDLYLYNWKSERTTWIDDVRVEDLGPVPEE